MQAGRAKTLKIFFSYAREDEKLKDELEKHLSSLKRRGLIACKQMTDLGLANAVTYRTKGVALYHLQRYIEALDAYEQAIHLNAGYAAAYANKGNTLNDLQRYPEALAAFEQALQAFCGHELTKQGTEGDLLDLVVTRQQLDTGLLAEQAQRQRRIRLLSASSNSPLCAMVRSSSPTTGSRLALGLIRPL